MQRYTLRISKVLQMRLQAQAIRARSNDDPVQQHSLMNGEKKASDDTGGGELRDNGAFAFNQRQGRETNTSVMMRTGDEEYAENQGLAVEVDDKRPH